MTQYISLNTKLSNSQLNKLKSAIKNKAKVSSIDIKLPKNQISKMIQSVGFLSRILGLLLKRGLPLRKNMIKPLAKKCFNSFSINCSNISSRNT